MLLILIYLLPTVSSHFAHLLYYIYIYKMLSIFIHLLLITTVVSGEITKTIYSIDIELNHLYIYIYIFIYLFIYLFFTITIIAFGENTKKKTYNNYDYYYI